MQPTQRLSLEMISQLSDLSAHIQCSSSQGFARNINCNVENCLCYLNTPISWQLSSRKTLVGEDAE